MLKVVIIKFIHIHIYDHSVPECASSCTHLGHIPDTSTEHSNQGQGSKFQWIATSSIKGGQQYQNSMCLFQLQTISIEGSPHRPCKFRQKRPKMCNRKDTSLHVENILCLHPVSSCFSIPSAWRSMQVPSSQIIRCKCKFAWFYNLFRDA